MKSSSFVLTCILLLATSNTDSCGTERPNARENPDSQTSVRPTPAPSPKYGASSPATEYAETLGRREDESARRYQERSR